MGFGVGTPTFEPCAGAAGEIGAAARVLQLSVNPD